MSRPTALPGLTTTASPHAEPAAAPGSSAERQRLATLAAEFESTLVLEMIKTMRKSMLDEEAEGEGLGADTFSGTIDVELSRHLSSAGGLGLQKFMLDAWDRQTGNTASPASAIGALAGLTTGSVDRMTAASAPRPSAVSAAARTPAPGVGAEDANSADNGLEIAGRVSSAYGWRRDPFQGTAKFHSGIDFAARYGTEVPAASDGTVVAAGEQGSYGLTVVVKHRDGYQTRYAHLSSLDVREGDAVAKGAVVGRVGSTGRSTAPHLHFEVLQGGQRIDPERFVRNLASDIKGQ